MDQSSASGGADDNAGTSRNQSSLPRSGPPLPFLTSTPPLRSISGVDASPPSPAEHLPRSLYRVGNPAQHARRSRQSSRSSHLTDSNDSFFDFGTVEAWR